MKLLNFTQFLCSKLLNFTQYKKGGKLPQDFEKVLNFLFFF